MRGAGFNVMRRPRYDVYIYRHANRTRKYLIYVNITENVAPNFPLKACLTEVLRVFAGALNTDLVWPAACGLVRWGYEA